MHALRQRTGEKARPLRRIYRLLRLPEVQIHAADHHGHQMPEMQRRRIRAPRKRRQRRTRAPAHSLRLLAFPGLQFHLTPHAYRRAAVKNARASASAFAGASAAHEFAFVAFRAFDAHGDRPRVFALRVAGAADKFAEAAVLFHQSVAAERAFLIELFIRLMRDASALDKTPRSLAVRITGASEKRAKAAALDGHLLAAIVAVLGLGFPASLFRSLRGEVLNEIAFGIARAAQEESVAANAFEQLALAALFALFPRRDAGLIGKHLVVGLVEVDDEFLPELFDEIGR